MINDAIRNAINDQIRNEFEASHIYLAMSATFDQMNLTGLADWMRQQSDEERAHGMKLYDFLLDHDAEVVLQGIPAPTVGFSTPVEAFEAVLKHEQKVTAQVNALYALAVQEGSYPTQVMLQWFIEEQVEEEKTARTVLDQLRMVAGDNAALLVLDRAIAAENGSRE